MIYLELCTTKLKHPLVEELADFNLLFHVVNYKNQDYVFVDTDLNSATKEESQIILELACEMTKLGLNIFDYDIHFQKELSPTVSLYECLK